MGNLMRISEEIKSLEVSPKKIREFGLLVGGVFLLLGGLALWRGRPAAPCFLGIGGFLFFFGVVYPAILKPLYRAWMIFAILLGWVMSRVMLSLLFFIAITPIGLCMRLQGKDLLDQKFPDPKDSFWTLRNKDSESRDACERQY